MIQSFRDPTLETMFETGKYPKRMPSDLRSRVRSKLALLDAAKSLEDLRSPPGNHLEKLKGDLKDLHSIRVSKQFRFIFEWKDGVEDL